MTNYYRVTARIVNRPNGAYMETIITVASGRAFGASSSQWGYTACVSSDPTDGVTVYDAVAGHYTACHALTLQQVARLRRLATRDSGTEGDLVERGSYD